MRADRLLSILMLLQKHGRLTASVLAEELEVSVRTIYRDVEALSSAGVPIYTERGSGGGCALLESYRSGLTGLTINEVRALFLAGIPSPLTDLGIGDELRAAHRKLSVAVPESQSGETIYASQWLLLDSEYWSQKKEPVPGLSAVHEALKRERRLSFTYCPPLPGQPQIGFLVDPYGLVAKANTWYLVAGKESQTRVFRVGYMLNAAVSDQTAVRPADFDLATFWRSWCLEFEQNRPQYTVELRIAADLLPYLAAFVGDVAHPTASSSEVVDETGWTEMTLSFERLEEARRRLLGLGGAVEVLKPEALRRSVLDFARQIVARYEKA